MNATPPLVREPDAGARPRVLAMANQKGGVGKTTTAINLGTALAAIGERVLIIDLDPQGNASTGLGIDRKSRVTSSYDMLVGERTLRDVIMPTAVPRLLIAPSTMDLLGVELEIAGHDDRSYKLRNALRAYCNSSADRPDSVTYVVVDCPPSLNLLTINALAGQVVADVRAHMGDKVYETVIPRNVRLSEAPSHGKPALLYDLKCAGSQAYLKLASEVIRREGRWRAA